MINWLHYLLEVNIYLTIAYSCYWLLLRKETFYTANRVYLLAGTVMCFVIPLTQIGALLPPDTIAEQTVTIIQNHQFSKPTSYAPAQQSFLTLNKALGAAYCTGMMYLTILFILKLYRLFKLILSSPKVKGPMYTLIYQENCPTPYSFLHFLFAGKNEPMTDVMLNHELTHIRQKHTWDILFLEVVKIINWFNPVVYLIQHHLKALHEFEADQQTIHQNISADQYVDFLIGYAHKTGEHLLVNHFSEYKLLKNRIIMLYQKPSGKLARLKYLVAAPVCAGLLCASTLSFSKTYGWISLGNKHTATPSLHMVATPGSNLRLNVLGGNTTVNSRKIKARDKDVKRNKYATETSTQKDQGRPLSDHNLKVKSTTDEVQDSEKQLPADTTLKNFYKHMGRTVRYPKVDRETHTSGHLIALIKTDNDGIISEAYILKGLSEEIDKEVLRNIKSFEQKLPNANTYYSLPVTLVLMRDSDGKQLPFKQGNTSTLDESIPKPQHVKQLSEVVIVGYNVK